MKDQGMPKTVAILGLVVVLTFSGCLAGPSYLSRTVDDWQNTNYEKDPLITGLLTSVLPVYPLAWTIAMIPDVLVLNTVQFWGWDVWEGKGSSHTHENPRGDVTPWFPKWFHGED